MISLSCCINTKPTCGDWLNVTAGDIFTFHSATSLPNRVDQVQSSFLVKLGLPKQQAFLDFNLAPTVLRRDVAILGLLHKRVLGQSHRTFEKLLPFYSERFDTGRGFGHTRQLYGQWLEATHHPIFSNG